MEEEKITVMLIDDDPMANIYNKMIIKKLHPNTETIAFDNARGALDFLEDNNNRCPDLILLDLNMPEMNGWDFMIEFEKLCLDIEVIIVSSSERNEDKDKCKEFSGISNYFVKPITANAIPLSKKFTK